jgi:hypothetical protein
MQTPKVKMRMRPPFEILTQAIPEFPLWLAKAPFPWVLAPRHDDGRPATQYVLVWSRKEEVWRYPEGSTRVVTMKVGEAAGPFTRLRGRGNRGFIFG